MIHLGRIEEHPQPREILPSLQGDARERRIAGVELLDDLPRASPARTSRARATSAEMRPTR